MPTFSSSTQTPSSESRSPFNDSEHQQLRHPPLHSPQPSNSAPNDFRGAIARQLDVYDSLGVTNSNGMLLGGRSRIQSPPPARPSTPILQMIQPHPSLLRPAYTPPTTPDRPIRTRGGDLTPIRQPRQPPPRSISLPPRQTFSIDPAEQGSHLHPHTPPPSIRLPHSNHHRERSQRPEGPPIPQLRPAPVLVATPAVQHLQAALTNNHSRFVTRLELRKTELLAALQPHCPRLGELCGVLCSCCHANDSTEAPDSDSGDAIRHIPSLEHAHTWLLTYVGLHEALWLLKEIMQMEMMRKTYDQLKAAEALLKDILKAQDEEANLMEVRTGRRVYSRWGVFWDKNEEERKHWIRGGYEEVLKSRRSDQTERGDSLQTVSLARTVMMQQQPVQTPNESRPLASLLRRQPAGPVVHDLSMLRETESPESWGETIATETAVVRRARVAARARIENTRRGTENTPPQSTPGRDGAAAAVANATHMMNQRLMAESFESFTTLRREAGRRASMAATAREDADIAGTTQNTDQANPAYISGEHASWPSEAAPSGNEAVNEREYEVHHFRPLPPANTDTQLDRHIVARGDAVQQAPWSSLSNTDLEARELARRAVELRSQLSNLDLENRELSRRIAEQNLPNTQRVDENVPLSDTQPSYAQSGETAEQEERAARQWHRAGHPSHADIMVDRHATRMRERERDRQRDAERERERVDRLARIMIAESEGRVIRPELEDLPFLTLGEGTFSHLSRED